MDRSTFGSDRSGFIVRQLVYGDFRQFDNLFEEVDRLHREALPRYFRKPNAPARTPETFSGWLADPNTGLFGAEKEGTLVGAVYTLIRLSPSSLSLHVPRTFGLIDVLVVDPRYRKMGIGAALVKQAQLWAQGKGATQMEINVWEFNSSAMTFYEDLGYGTISRKLSLSL
jgi:GNAT superfamily N-acetyltransferase